MAGTLRSSPIHDAVLAGAHGVGFSAPNWFRMWRTDSFAGANPEVRREALGSLGRDAAMLGATGAVGLSELAKPAPKYTPMAPDAIGSMRNASMGEVAKKYGSSGARGNALGMLRSAPARLGAAARATPLGMALGGAAEGAVRGYLTPTEEYEKKTGLRGLPARAAGVMGDVGNAMTLGGAGYVGQKVADWMDKTRPFEQSNNVAAPASYRNMPQHAAATPWVNPLKFRYNDPSTWPK